MPTLQRARRGLCATVLAGLAALTLVACGGSDDAPAADNPPTVGAAGGTVAHASGAQVEVPAGALEADTTLRVAQDGSGAPPLPTGLAAAGSVFALTPHGSRFGEPVRVRIPAPGVAPAPNQQLKLAKAEVGGGWVVLADSELDASGRLTAQVSSFSYFVPVLVTYPIPLPSAPPLAIAGLDLTCSGSSCFALAGEADLYLAVQVSGSQLPAGCVPGSLEVKTGSVAQLPATTTGDGTYRATERVVESAKLFYGGLDVMAELQCRSATDPAQRITFASRTRPGVYAWLLTGSGYPSLRALALPTVQYVVPGQAATVRATLAGGAYRFSGVTTSSTDQAIVEWQRSDDGGATWRVVGLAYQSEANQDPFANPAVVGRYWEVAYGFTAGAADQGALLRVRACYTPPDRNVVPPPCATSNATQLTVLASTAAPTIDTPPRALLVRSGQTASFGATASGSPAPTLQWQTREANSSGPWTDVPGATAGTYTTAVLGLADNGRQLRVVARNAVGTAESAPVTVSVSDLDVAPTITTQPAPLAVAAGGDAVFAVAARGTEALSYQWRRNGVAITGANASVLRLAGVDTASAGRYSVVVSNAAGSATSTEATLDVTSGAPAPTAPTITTPPAAVRVNSGNTATFAVGAAGSGPLSYQWLKDGNAIAGATAAYYTLAEARSTDGGAYAVRVSNAVGSVTSAAAVLSVSDTPAAPAVAVSIGTQPAPQVQLPGGSATFAVAASGSGPLAYQWLRNGSPIAGATGPVLTIRGVTSNDAASYAVTVSNTLGSVTSDGATLTVVGSPTLVTPPQAQTVVAGASATFSVVASGSSLGYQWIRDGAAIAGATSASLTTGVLTEADSGASYSVIVYNGAGAVLSPLAVLTVQPAAITTVRVASVNGEGQPANAAVDLPSASADGRRVAFRATGTDLLPGLGSSARHAYVRDLAEGRTGLVNTTTDGRTSALGVNHLKLARGGRHVVFTSLANDLVAGDSNRADDVFVRDLQTGRTVRANVLRDGSQDERSGNAIGAAPDISADGRYVLMASGVDLAGDGALLPDVGYFVRDMTAGTTRRVALEGSPYGSSGAISADGRVVMVLTLQGSLLALEAWRVDDGAHSTLFTTTATDALVPEDQLAVSADGRCVALLMNSPTWLGGAAARHTQVVLYDRQAGGSLPAGLALASTGPGGAGDGESRQPSVSDDCRFVGYLTAAPNLTGGAANGAFQLLMLHDRQSGASRIASRSVDGEPVPLPAGRHAVLGNGAGLLMLAPAQQMLGGALANTVHAFVVP